MIDCGFAKHTSPLLPSLNYVAGAAVATDFGEYIVNNSREATLRVREE
jgi:hypothetical protein